MAVTMAQINDAPMTPLRAATCAAYDLVSVRRDAEAA